MWQCKQQVNFQFTTQSISSIKRKYLWTDEDFLATVPFLRRNHLSFPLAAKYLWRVSVTSGKYNCFWICWHAAFRTLSTDMQICREINFTFSAKTRREKWGPEYLQYTYLPMGYFSWCWGISFFWVTQSTQENVSLVQRVHAWVSKIAQVNTSCVRLLCCKFLQKLWEQRCTWLGWTEEIFWGIRQIDVKSSHCVQCLRLRKTRHLSVSSQSKFPCLLQYRLPRDSNLFSYSKQAMSSQIFPNAELSQSAFSDFAKFLEGDQIYFPDILSLATSCLLLAMAMFLLWLCDRILQRNCEHWCKQKNGWKSIIQSPVHRSVILVECTKHDIFHEATFHRCGSCVQW